MLSMLSKRFCIVQVVGGDARGLPCSSLRGSVICHSDDQREEDELLRTSPKNLGNTKVGVNVDVHEILRRFTPLNDNSVILLYFLIINY